MPLGRSGLVHIQDTAPAPAAGSREYTHMEHGGGIGMEPFYTNKIDMKIDEQIDKTQQQPDNNNNFFQNFAFNFL